MRVKPALLLILTVLTATAAAQPASGRLGPAAPEVSSLDQAYLTRFVRRHLERALSEAGAYEPPYVPEALVKLRCRVAVGLRLEGRLLGAGESDEMPILQGCRQAADKARAMADKRQIIDAADLARAVIDIELIGPREPVGSGRDLTAELSRRFEPGIHGIAAAFEDREILVRPSQLVSLEIFCDNDDELGHNCDRYAIAIENLQQKLGLSRQPPERDPAKVQFSRFQTRHWVEPRPRETPVELTAGLRFVAPDEITPDSLRAAMHDIGRYLCHRQTSDGSFSYEFLPGRDIYWPRGQNWVRQIGTAWVLARYARRTADPTAVEATSKAIAAFGKMVRPLKGAGAAAFVSTPDGGNSLGATALFCLTLMDAPDAAQHAELRADLLNAMAGLQREDGSFKTSFPPAVALYSQDFYPGEALLVIAREYAAGRDGRWREICDRALPFYTQYFRTQRPAMMAPWHMQAWGQLARTTQMRRYADFVYELADWVAASQITAPDVSLRIYDGALDLKRIGRSGIATAVHVEGLAEAARTAESLGDTDRAARYRSAIRRALRFVIQLRFRPEECYYVQSPREVLGGVRASPYEPSLRIDHSMHALAAIMGALDAETPPSAPAGGSEKVRR